DRVSLAIRGSFENPLCERASRHLRLLVGGEPRPCIVERAFQDVHSFRVEDRAVRAHVTLRPSFPRTILRPRRIAVCRLTDSTILEMIRAGLRPSGAAGWR